LNVDNLGVYPPRNLEQIVREASVPIKVSCALAADNLPDLQNFLLRCQEIGIARIVLRKLFGEQRAWGELLDLAGLGLKPRPAYRDNPVFDFFGVEVTLWDFAQTSSRSINLFSSGVISQAYLLADPHPQA
jgi:hypothetical protein